MDNVAPGVEWTVEVAVPNHNHDSVADVSAYPAAHRLSDEQRHRIAQLSDAGAAPKVILRTLRQQHQNCLLAANDIYNEKVNLHNRELDSCIPMEMLLDQLSTENVHHAVERDEKGRIMRFFFAPPTAAKLAREYSKWIPRLNI